MIYCFVCKKPVDKRYYTGDGWACENHCPITWPPAGPRDRRERMEHRCFACGSYSIVLTDVIMKNEDHYPLKILKYECDACMKITKVTQSVFDLLYEGNPQ